MTPKLITPADHIRAVDDLLEDMTKFGSGDELYKLAVVHALLAIAKQLHPRQGTGQ